MKASITFCIVSLTATLTAPSSAAIGVIATLPAPPIPLAAPLELSFDFLLLITFISSTLEKALFTSFAAFFAAVPVPAMSFAVFTALAPILSIPVDVFFTTSGKVKPNTLITACNLVKNAVTTLIAFVITGINTLAIGATTFPIAICILEKAPCNT